MTFNELKSEMMQNSEFKKEYDSLESEYDFIHQIISARIEKNMTQKQLAEKVGTKQSSIARLESGNYNPSLQFLQKVANALGKQLTFGLR